MTRQLITLACLTALSLSAGDSDRYKEDFHYSFPQGPGGHLDVSNFNGSVEITGWDQPTIDISGTKYSNDEGMLKAMKVTAAQEGTSVRVRSERPEPHNKWNCGAKLVIRVPKHTELQRIQTSNGSVKVEDIDGLADLTTSNGAVRVHNIRGHVEARTSNGAVELDRVDAGVNATTSNGSITIEGVKGTLHASTTNGAIRGTLTDAAPSEPIKLSTSNGAIDIRLQMPRNNDITASTSNGSITIRMPANASVRLNAQTSSHESIATDFDVQMRGTLTKNRVEGTIGNGGPLLQLTTSNGAVRILKL